MTTKTEHTPGPWIASQRPGHPWNVKISTTETVAVFGTAMQGTSAQQEANARLIAAAPELLACLSRIRNVVIPGGMAQNDIDTVIAKVGGR